MSDIAEKRRLISLIIQGVTVHAMTRKTKMPDGDLLLALAFRTVSELRQIAAAAGVCV